MRAPFATIRLKWSIVDDSPPEKSGRYFVSGPHVGAPYVAEFDVATGDWCMHIPVDAKEHLLTDALSRVSEPGDDMELGDIAMKALDEWAGESSFGLDIPVYPYYWMELPEDPLMTDSTDEEYVVNQGRAHRIFDRIERVLINAIMEEVRNET